MTKDEMAEKHDVPKMALSIAEFCVAHGISEKAYYNLKNAGQGPVEMHVGGRRMVSIEAAAEWRRRMEV